MICRRRKHEVHSWWLIAQANFVLFAFSRLERTTMPIRTDDRLEPLSKAHIWGKPVVEQVHESCPARKRIAFRMRPDILIDDFVVNICPVVSPSEQQNPSVIDRHLVLRIQADCLDFVPEGSMLAQFTDRPAVNRVKQVKRGCRGAIIEHPPFAIGVIQPDQASILHASKRPVILQRIVDRYS